MHLNKLETVTLKDTKSFQLHRDFDLLLPSYPVPGINQFLKACKQPNFHKHIFLKIPPKDGISGYLHSKVLHNFL